MNKEVIVHYSNGSKKFVTAGKYQYDHGLILRVYELPDIVGTIEAQFTNSKLSTTLNITGIKTDEYFDFEIPASITMFPINVIAYIYFTSSEYGKTVFEVEIPITPRPRPAEFIYTPEQIQGYNQLLEKLQQTIDQGVSDEQIESAVKKYMDENPTMDTDETLIITQDGKLSVNRSTSVEKDNTLPITSAAVYNEVGNINALLATI